MMTFSLTEIVAITGGIGTIIVGAYKMGSIARQVSTNERDIGVIYNKLDDIWRYVNGRGGTPPPGR